MMGPGIDAPIQERWELLWRWLCRERKTREEQIKRLLDLEQALRERRELVESDRDVPSKMDKHIRDLRSACTSPFLFHPLRRLFACRTDWGLIFIFAMPKRLRLVLGDSFREGTPTSLRPLGVSSRGELDEIHDLFVLSRAFFPLEQTHAWAEAAAFHGYLFELAEPGEEPESQGSLAARDDAGFLREESE